MSRFEDISITQNVQDDPNNSSTTNLDSLSSFVGTASSTLGVVGLQWSLKTTQNCLIYIEQSPDGLDGTWDISDSVNYYYAKGGTGGTIQALNSYWRIRVTNVGIIPTTEFRLQGVLCPIADPLPRTLSNYGNLQVVTSIRGDENTGRHVWVNPTSELNVSTVNRLVGTAFDNTTLDTNFWTSSVADGTITQSGGAVHITTTAAPAGSASYVSVRRGRFVPGSAMIFNASTNFETVGTVGNIRQIGAYDTDNGYFIQLSGAQFNLGTRKASVDALINSGAFNGNLGNSWMPVPGTHYKFGIEYTPLAAVWYVDDIRLHSEKTPHLSDTQTLPITMENVKTSGITDIELECDGTYIAR